VCTRMYTLYTCIANIQPLESVGSVRVFTKRHSLFKSYFFQTNLPVFKVKDSTVRRRYSDFEWLRNELERDSKVSY